MIDEMIKGPRVIVGLCDSALITVADPNSFLTYRHGCPQNRLAFKLGLAHGMYRNCIGNAYNVE